MELNDTSPRADPADRLTLFAAGNNADAATDAIPPGLAAALRDNPAEALRSISGPFALSLQQACGRSLIAVDRFAVQTLC